MTGSRPLGTYRFRAPTDSKVPPRPTVRAVSTSNPTSPMPATATPEPGGMGSSKYSTGYGRR